MFVRRINTSLVLRGVFVKPKVIPDALSSIGFSLANDLVTWNHASHGRARNKVFSISNISRPRCLSRTRNAPWRTLVPACEKTTTHMRENSHHRTPEHASSRSFISRRWTANIYGSLRGALRTVHSTLPGEIDVRSDLGN